MVIELINEEPLAPSTDIAAINAKHLRLRGSNRLLFVLGCDPKHKDYLPVCQQRCGCGLYHPCFLRASHVQEGIGCVFSSECGGVQ